MQIDVYSDPSCFEQLHDEWQSLMERAEHAPFFVAPEISQSWWQAFGRGKLHIFTIRDGGKLLGLAPMYECDGVLSFTGSREVSDYLDVIVDPSVVPTVLAEFWQFLLSQKNWQQLDFLSLSNGSTFRSFLNEQKIEGITIETKQQDVCPVLQLPASWDEYLSFVGKKQRHEIKRKWKNLEDQVQPEFVKVTEAADLDKYLTEFIRLHQISSQEKAAFWSEDQINYFQKISLASAQHGWLRLYFVKVKENFAAAMLGFSYRGQFLLYNSGYDPVQFAGLSPGIVLTAYTIQDAIESGLRIYDFLRGDEEYKFRFRAVAEPVWDVVVKR
jgi:CelD/BcsL family acetyltransferase involved in cellulose biosynthesis